MKRIHPTEKSSSIHSFGRLLAAACVTAVLTIGCGGGGGGGGGVADGGDVISEKPWPVGDGEIAVFWRAPTERENGEPLPLSELKGYRIHWGPTDNPTEYSVTINDPYATSFTLEGVVPGSYELAMTAIDSNGRESAPSNALQAAL
ncbi:MAG: fibronectin type III domain-containing protein [Thiohalomonadaceae bacterium]